MDNQPQENTLESTELTVTDFSPIGWVPLISLLLMAGLACYLLVYVVNLEQTQVFAETIGRITWSISILFFALTITVTFVAAFQEIFGTRLRSVKLRISALTLFLAAALPLLILLPGVKEFKFNVMLLGNTTYKVAPVAKNFVIGVQILGALALTALAIAVSLVLSQNRVKSPVATPSALARDFESVRKLLYIGAIALVAGTLEASALYSWAVSMMPAGQVPSDLVYYSTVKDLPQLMGTLNGLFYSILLAGIFAPAFIQLRGVANRLVDEAKPGVTYSERNEWLKAQGVDISISQQLFSALAILSPTLAGGPLTILLGLIAN